MASFLLHCRNEQTGELKQYRYETDPIDIFDHDESILIKRRNPMTYSSAHKTHPTNPGVKRNLSRVAIQLGLGCNLACSYCLQGSMNKERESAPRDYRKFLHELEKSLPPGDIEVEFEFWGGEPLLYWKILLPLATELRILYPRAGFSMPTNGTLLTYEINDKLVELGFEVTISHDGPGHHQRGPDPLDDAYQRAVIMDLYNRLRPKELSFFNSVLNSENMSHTEIVEWFKTNVCEDIVFANNQLASVYDVSAERVSLKTMTEVYAYRNDFLAFMRSPDGHRIKSVNRLIASFIYSIAHKRPADSLVQYCGRDDEHTICLNLDGDVVACQNLFSTDTVEVENRSNKIGHISKLSEVKLDCAIHWSHRDMCSTCPVLPICAGACMIQGQDSPFLRPNCDSRYTHNIPLFAATIEILTGFLPFKIEGLTKPLPKERELLWSADNDTPA